MLKHGAVVSIDRDRTGTPDSVGEEILAHLDGLYRFALRLTRDAQLAQDLTQESVLRALEHQDNVVRHLRAWLFQTLYHTFISHYRRVSGHDATDEAFSENGELSRTGIVPGALPDLIAVEDVRRSIQALPQGLRAVVWLSDAEEFRLREIAEILGLPLGTVASRLWRGRQELRRLLSAYRPPRL